jgi:B12-binding domain/radical SAM domain protein
MKNRFQFILRQTPNNRFTVPVLLTLLEQNSCSRHCTFYVINSLQTHLLQKWDREKIVFIYSFMTHQIGDVWNEIKRLKKTLGDKPIFLAGGPHPTGDPLGTLKMGFDTVCAGEGETTLPLFFRLLLQQGNGIRGRIIRSKTQADLDESFPISRTIPMIPPLEITRGCRNHCRFCQTAGGRPVHRSLESVKVYLDELVRRNYRHRVGFICPSGFEYGSEKPGLVHPEKIEEILAMAAEKKIRHIEYGIFPSEVRPDTVRPELLDLIKKYCSNNKITLGAQTASDRLLKELRRGHTHEHIVQAAAWIHENGFLPVLDFIVGFPGETEEDRRETLDCIKNLNTRYHARSQVHYFLPLAGTAMEKQKPSPLDPKSIQRLKQYTKAGITTNWWETGMILSGKIVNVRQELAQKSS